MRFSDCKYSDRGRGFVEIRPLRRSSSNVIHFTTRHCKASSLRNEVVVAYQHCLAYVMIGRIIVLYKFALPIIERFAGFRLIMKLEIDVALAELAELRSLHFIALDGIKFLRHHSLKFSRSIWNSSKSIRLISFASSAHTRQSLETQTSGRSLISIRNKTGHRSEPCGTLVIQTVSEKEMSTLATCLRICRHDFIVIHILPSTSICQKLRRRTPLSTLSKVFS